MAKFKNDFDELKSIQEAKSNKGFINLLAEFKRTKFNSSYILSGQIESEEELAQSWLSDREKSIFHKNTKPNG